MRGAKTFERFAQENYFSLAVIEIFGTQHLVKKCITHSDRTRKTRIQEKELLIDQ